jgi:hypothetical protein
MEMRWLFLGDAAEPEGSEEGFLRVLVGLSAWMFCIPYRVGLVVGVEPCDGFSAHSCEMVN